MDAADEKYAGHHCLAHGLTRAFPSYGLPRHIGEEDRRIADAAELSERFLRELSGGERQKAYLAATLAQQCDTILMDEPTAYLDISRQFQVLALAKRLAEEGKAVAAVLHDLPWLSRLRTESRPYGTGA